MRFGRPPPSSTSPMTAVRAARPRALAAILVTPSSRATPAAAPPPARAAQGPARAALVTVVLGGAALAACAPPPQIAVASGGDGADRRPGLQIAAPGPEEGGDVVVVNANVARTFAGHFKAGERVRIEVIDTQWTPEPGAAFHDAAGVPGERCVGDGDHPCTGGGAPLLGLILLTASSVPAGARADTTCMGIQRLYIPNGVEFTVPVDAEISLGPNDWEDGLANNRGAIEVAVERAAGKTGAASERASLSVGALSASTPAGQFRAGEYIRISVLGGSWSNDPGAPLVGSEGYARQTCGGEGHVCVGGEGKPLMGLVLKMSCASVSQPMMPLQRIDRAYIPRGADIVLEQDADLFLAPNDRDDHLGNNSGSARVRVRAAH